jgi:hypothetical protein
MHETGSTLTVASTLFSWPLQNQRSIRENLSQLQPLSNNSIFIQRLSVAQHDPKRNATCNGDFQFVHEPWDLENAKARDSQASFCVLD